MKEFIKYIKDIRFWIPLSLFLLLELFLRSGMYDRWMQPRSAARSVQRILDWSEKSNDRPEILILGTSVARQGILLGRLNEALRKENISAISAACDGAPLIVQNLLYRRMKNKFPSIKYTIHVSENSFPMTARRPLEKPARAMLSRFSASQVLGLMVEYRISPSLSDFFYFNVRLASYQNDVRDLFLNPGERIRRLNQLSREGPLQPDNSVNYRLTIYRARDLSECLEVSSHRMPEFDAKGIRVTDEAHREAVNEGCRLYGMLPAADSPDAAARSELFFRQLEIFYREMERDGLHSVTVIPPLSTLFRDENSRKMAELWTRHVSAGRRIDMRNLFSGEKDPDIYFADTVHLNREGAEKFTHALAENLLKLWRSRRTQTQ